MSERIPISKSLRFEVFKRDHFKCQYCGVAAPNVLLRVDHIRPVADGGTNDIVNLITSCEPCNNGKGAKLLSENAAISKARNQMEQLQERREQLELMMEWQRGLMNLDDEQASQVAQFWEELCPGLYLNETGLGNLRKLIAKYSVSEVLQAMRKSCDGYAKRDADGNVTSESGEVAFNMIGGICRVERQSQDKPYLKEIYYIRGILRKRLDGRYYKHHDAFSLLENAYLDEVSIDSLRAAVLEARSWTDFTTLIGELVDDARGA